MSVTIRDVDYRKWPRHVLVLEAPTIQEIDFEWECAYCGSLLHGGREKCPNCGAPKVAAGKGLTGVILCSGMTARQFEQAAQELKKRMLLLGRGRGT